MSSDEGKDGFRVFVFLSKKKAFSCLYDEEEKGDVFFKICSILSKS